MSRTNKKTAERQSAEETKYPTAKLLRSRHLSAYQTDFARAILVEPSYTISEARKALDAALRRKTARQRAGGGY